MKLKAGAVYFVSDDFFKKVNDPYLKINYETTKRPHYFAFRDSKTSLYWLVPCSSKIEKFETIIQKKQAQHKPTDTIKIVRIQNQKSALLFQDMFPATEKYISEPYIRGGQPVLIADPKIVAELEKNAQKVITLLHRGIKFTPTQPDVNRIEKLMLSELSQERTQPVTSSPTIEAPSTTPGATQPTQDKPQAPTPSGLPNNATAAPGQSISEKIQEIKNRQQQDRPRLPETSTRQNNEASPARQSIFKKIEEIENSQSKATPPIMPDKQK